MTRSDTDHAQTAFIIQVEYNINVHVPCVCLILFGITLQFKVYFESGSICFGPYLSEDQLSTGNPGSSTCLKRTIIQLAGENGKEKYGEKDGCLNCRF